MLICWRNGVSEFVKHIFHHNSSIWLLAWRCHARICSAHQVVWYKTTIKVAHGCSNIPVKVYLAWTYDFVAPRTDNFSLEISVTLSVFFYYLVGPHVLIRCTWDRRRTLHVLRSWLVFGRAMQSLLHCLELLDVRLSRLVHRHVTATVWSTNDHLFIVWRIRLLFVQIKFWVVTRCRANCYILSRIVQIRDKWVFAQ